MTEKNIKSEKISSDSHPGIKWPRLIKGTLIRRYKRFIADVKLDDGRTVSAHCPNSGRMTECCEPGRPVYLSHHDIPSRKLKYTWELISMPTSIVGVNTQVPNHLVAKSIEKGTVPQLSGYDSVQREVKTGTHSRIDLALKNNGRSMCYVEIKNCTLVKDNVAVFPDAVTTRGKKHLVELQRLVKEGKRCAMFFLIQRMDAKIFKPADHIDPDYGMELRNAISNGVEIIAYDVHINLSEIRLNKEIPCRFHH